LAAPSPERTISKRRELVDRAGERYLLGAVALRRGLQPRRGVHLPLPTAWC